MQEQYFQAVTISQESEYVPGDKLNPKHYANLPIERLVKPGDKQCSVCLDKFKKGEEVKMLPCHHMFHDGCIRPWFSSNTKCPNCRFDLNEHFESR